MAVLTLVWTARGWGGDGQVGGRAPDDLLDLLLLGAAASLLLRRRAPLLPLAVTCTVAVVVPALGYPTSGAFVVPLVVAIHVATARDRRPWAVGAAGAFLVCFAVAALRDLVQPSAVLAVPVWLVAALVSGEASRNRRRAIAEARRRSREVRRTREEEDRRRASEERVRIAREVHDVVSHSIAMINVQAGVAAHLLDDDPEQARRALVAIKEASRDALRDLRATLGVLRAVDDGASPDGRAPTPGLARLPALAERLEAAGLVVHVDTELAGLPLPAGVELAAYRIVQEAVSNVLRHAEADEVSIGVRRRGDELAVRVVDDGRGVDPVAVARPTGSGRARSATGAGSLVRRARTSLSATGQDEPVTASWHQERGGGDGLRGMRERAAALGGELEAGPVAGGGWRVAALLPVVDDPTRGGAPGEGRP